MRRLAILAAAAALATTAGCHPRRPTADLPAEPAELLAEVRAAQDVVRRVQGQARLKIDARGFDGTVNQFIAAEKPDRVHLETLDFFGNVAAVLVAAGDRFAFYDAREKVFYRGRPTPENLARLVPLAIDAPALVTILCGSAPLVDGAPAELRPGKETVSLVLDGGERRQVLAIGRGAAIERSRVRLVGADGAVTDAPAPGAYDLGFDVFRTWGGARFPTDVALRSSDPRVRLDLHWQDVEVNGPVDDALFTMEPPRGARIVELEEPLGRAGE